LLARTSIGGLLLEEVDGWTFSVQQDIIAGTFRDDPGILRIKTITANSLPHPVTHDACLSRAAELAEMANATPSDWNMQKSITGPYGSANFERGSDRVYCWYCCRSPGIIVGAYTCPAKLTRTYANRGVRSQCNRMITSAIFDRRIWGANDEITQLMIDVLGPDDPPDENDGDARVIRRE
jgi:hypothetical protein